MQYRAASQRELHYRNDCGGSATRGPARDGMRAGWDDLEAKRPRQKRSDDVWRDRPPTGRNCPYAVSRDFAIRTCTTLGAQIKVWT